MKCIVIWILCFQVTVSIHTYKTMFISAKDSYRLWIDGVEVEGLLYADVWSYPDRVEIRSDNRLIAVEITTTEEPSISHGLIVQSQSGIFDTINNDKWRCKDVLEEDEKKNWYKPNYVKPKDWPASFVYAQNSNFESPMNPWLGPVRLMTSNATWIGSFTFIDSTGYCLMFLEEKVIMENNPKASRKIKTHLNKASNFTRAKNPKSYHPTANKENKTSHKEGLKDFKVMQKTIESRYKRNVTEEDSGGKMEFKKKKLLSDEFNNKMKKWFMRPMSTNLGSKIDGTEDTTTELKEFTQSTTTEAIPAAQPLFDYSKIDRTLYITAINDFSVFLDRNPIEETLHAENIHLLDAVEVPASTQLIEVEADFTELDIKSKPGLLMYSPDGVLNSDDRWHCGKSLKTEYDDESVYIPGFNLFPATIHNLESFVPNRSEEAKNKQMYNMTINEILTNTTARWIWSANQNNLNIHCQLRLRSKENEDINDNEKNTHMKEIQNLNKNTSNEEKQRYSNEVNADTKMTPNPQTTNTQNTTGTTIETNTLLGKTRGLPDFVEAGENRGQPNIKRSIKNFMEKDDFSYKEKLFRNPDFDKHFYITAHQDFSVFIDGRRINRIFDKPSPTPKDEVPTTHYILPTNVSLLAVHVVAIESKKLPAFLAGDKEGFYKSDKRWRCTNGPYVDLDWFSTEYDDSTWSQVVVGASNNYKDVGGKVPPTSKPDSLSTSFGSLSSNRYLVKRGVERDETSKYGVNKRGYGFKYSQEIQLKNLITESTLDLKLDNGTKQVAHVMVLRYSDEDKPEDEEVYESRPTMSSLDDEGSDIDSGDEDEENKKNGSGDDEDAENDGNDDDEENKDESNDYEEKNDDEGENTENDYTENVSIKATDKRDTSQELESFNNSFPSSSKTTENNFQQTEEKSSTVMMSTSERLISTTKEGSKNEIVLDLAENSSINFGNMAVMPYSLYTTKYEFFNGTLLDYTPTSGNSTGIKKKKKKNKYCKGKMKKTKYGFSRSIPKSAVWITAVKATTVKSHAVSEIFCRLKLDKHGKSEYGLKDSMKKKIKKIEDEFCEIISKF